MRTQKMKIALASVLGSFLLGACGMSGQAEARAKGTGTPEDAVQCTMESLKELDLDIFNECTDNYVGTYYNWFGIPVGFLRISTSFSVMLSSVIFLAKSGCKVPWNWSL